VCYKYHICSDFGIETGGITLFVVAGLLSVLI
jgi:hypothetical protein